MDCETRFNYPTGLWLIKNQRVDVIKAELKTNNSSIALH